MPGGERERERGREREIEYSVSKNIPQIACSRGDCVGESSLTVPLGAGSPESSDKLTNKAGRRA